MGKRKVQEWDEYRVSLFKKKLRETLPAMSGIRFGRSKGRCHLILDIRWRYYSISEKVFEYALAQLKNAGIQAEAKAMFDWGSKMDYIAIPIDQAALPERCLKRGKGR